jgi:GNAT superfamily N-acetyltransferase
VRAGVNVEISRLCVVDAYRGRGVGRGLVEQLMKAAAPIEGALHVEATHGELGFFSLLGFEAQGPAYAHGRTGEWHRHMVYKFPACAPASDCVGLHHTAIRVLDIERSLAWYGCVGFIVSEKFYTPGGCRACFVEGLGVRIELVESTTGAGVSGVQDWPGFLVFDVTRGCRDLDSFLAHLRKRNGGMLTVTGEPAHQVIGSKLLSVATVRPERRRAAGRGSCRPRTPC